MVNKADRTPEAARLAGRIDGAVCISARTGGHGRAVESGMADRLRVADRVVQLEMPWAHGDVLAAVHREGEVVEQTDGGGSR